MSLNHLELISFPLLHSLLLTPLQSGPLHTVPIVVTLLFMVIQIFILLLAFFTSLHLVMRTASVCKDLSWATSSTYLGLIVEAVTTIGERVVFVFLLDGWLRVERVLVVNGERMRMETLLKDWVRENCLRCRIGVRECCPCILA